MSKRYYIYLYSGNGGQVEVRAGQQEENLLACLVLIQEANVLACQGKSLQNDWVLY